LMLKERKNHSRSREFTVPLDAEK